MGATPELIAAVRESAARLGINPSDLLTAMSYETGGSLDPWAPGPTTQWGQHRGLIQWGEPQRQKYGVTKDMPVADQVTAAERYLKDAGVRPGMGMLDVYSAINAGRVGLYNRSDANNGGAPGTVADKVATQMYGHRQRANALLGGEGITPAPTQTAAAPSAAPSAAPPAPFGLAGAAPATDGEDAGGLDPKMLAMMMQASQQPAAEPPPPMPQIQFPQPPGLARARALALAMINRPMGGQG